MNRIRRGAAIAVVALIAACTATTETEDLYGPDGDGGPAPLPAPSLAEFSGNFITCPVAATADSGSMLIGPEGGLLKFGKHWIRVPKGALSTDVRIRAIAEAGDTLRVTFHPKGLEFAEPARVKLKFSDCTANPSAPYRIVFVNDSMRVLEHLNSKSEFDKKVIFGEIDHFSRYAIAY